MARRLTSHLLAILVFLISFCHVQSDLGNGIVNLPNGVRLHGKQFQEDGTTVYYGIKYGTAGRFEHSKPNTDFAYLKDPNRVKQGHACPHFPMAIPGMPPRNLDMNEDCLYLDVYVPSSNKENSVPRPVFFWIYGGAFKVGDKDMYNATILAKASDVIVVTVNYRVSAFGFLSTEDKEASGNWALGDLKLALNWTIDNIASFGGDPTKTTISGESAGAVLASALMLDDGVRHKVKAAIAFSGSILSGWAITKDPKATALTLAGHLGCSNSSTTEAIICMKAMPYDNLQIGMKALINDRTKMEIQFSPVIDGLHIPKSPADILRERAAKADKTSEEKAGKLITGYLREDSAMFTLLIAPEALMDNATHNYTSALKMLTMYNVGMTRGKCPPEVVAQKGKAVFDFYNVSEGVTSDDALNVYHQITSDMVFGVFSMKESMMYANVSADAGQMFLLSFDPGFKRLGAFHGMDVFHLFRGIFDVVLKDKTSERVSKTLHDYVHQIAYTGRYDGPFFGREGNYHELTQDGKFTNKKADFSAKIRLLEDTLDCGS